MRLPTHYDMPPTFGFMVERRKLVKSDEDNTIKNIKIWGRVGWVKNKSSEPLRLITPCAFGTNSVTTLLLCPKHSQSSMIVSASFDCPTCDVLDDLVAVTHRIFDPWPDDFDLISPSHLFLFCLLDLTCK